MRQFIRLQPIMHPLNRLVSVVAALVLFQLLSFAADPEPRVLTGLTRDGSATVSPDHGISGEFGTWTVHYIVGGQGIRVGGGIRVQLPDSWHAGPRNSANRLQATAKEDSHYVSATSSRREVKLHTTVESATAAQLVKHAKESLDGRSERYVFVVRIELSEGELRPGDSLSVTYGDRSGGSPGYRAAAISTSAEPILIALDANGDAQFRLLADPPNIQSLPGDAVEMQFHAPSMAIAGRPFELLVSLVDKESNPVVRADRLRISVLSGEMDVPERVDVPPFQGFVRFKGIPKASGVIRLRAETEQLELVATSNPTLVSEAAPDRFLYWGDLHSHSAFSWDGVGDRSYEYARDISGLDFYALTDHSVEPPTATLTRGLSEQSWERYNALAETFHDPPYFVTLHAYECSFGNPYGHHNVYFRAQPGPLAYPSRVTLPELWQSLAAGEALTIPHHTGKFPSKIDFTVHDPRFRRNFEIYSGHGLSEVHNPDHPLSFENSTFTSPSTSLPPGTFAQDVWMQGLQLSTISSSDDHRAHPGQPHFGLAAIQAPGLTRDDIFQGLYDRHTYGTTGAKILLQFTLNDVPMGGLGKVTSAPELKILALGTAQIHTVELLRFRPPGNRFEVIQSWHPDVLDFQETYRDEDFQPGAVYYVRLEQRSKVRDRVAQAWSSPIWTEPE